MSGTELRPGNETGFLPEAGKDFIDSESNHRSLRSLVLTGYSTLLARFRSNFSFNFEALRWRVPLRVGNSFASEKQMHRKVPSRARSKAWALSAFSNSGKPPKTLTRTASQRVRRRERRGFHAEASSARSAIEGKHLARIRYRDEESALSSVEEEVCECETAQGAAPWNRNTFFSSSLFV